MTVNVNTLKYTTIEKVISPSSYVPIHGAMAAVKIKKAAIKIQTMPLKD